MLTSARVGARLSSHRNTQAMSEEQLSALHARLKDDAGLEEKLKGAADLDAVAAIAKEAGFDISKAAWLKESLDKRGLSGSSEQERVLLPVNCI